MLPDRPHRLRRLLAFVTDWFLCGLLVIVPLFAVLSLGLEWVTALVAPLGSISLLGGFICRDFLLNGRSLGKRLFGLAVVDRNFGVPPYGRQLVLKGLFFFLYPIDGAFLLFTGRSLGERATGTAVIRSSKPTGPVNRKRLVVFAAVILAITLPCSLVMGFALNSVKQSESYRLAYDYLQTSETFAASGADEDQISLSGYSSHSVSSPDGITTYTEITFQAGSDRYEVCCHYTDADGWYVCTDHTEFD